MKLTMKKVVLTVIAIIMAMMSMACYYETEEVPNELIMALLDEGFTRDDDEPNMWYYYEIDADYDDDYQYVIFQAWFDTDKNIGIGTVVGVTKYNEVRVIASGAVRWNNIDGCGEELGYWESDI